MALRSALLVAAICSSVSAAPKNTWTKCLNRVHIHRAVELGAEMIVAGDWYSDGDFGDGKKLGRGSDMIAKLDATGGVVWTHKLTGAIQINSLAIGKDGAIYFAGFMNGDGDYGGGVVKGQGGATDAFVAALDAGGKLLWAKQIGAKDSFNAFLELAVGSELTLRAEVGDGFDFGDGKRAATNKISSQHVAHARFTLAGKLIAATWDAPAPLADANRRTQRVGNTTLAAWDEGEEPKQVSVVVTGKKPWEKHFDNSGYGLLGGALLDANGNAFVAGGYEYSVDLGDGHRLKTPHTAAFLADIRDGKTQWAVSFGPTTTEKTTAWIDEIHLVDGALLVGGPFSGELAVGGKSVVAKPSTDDVNHDGLAGWLASVGPDGQVRWLKALPARVHLVEIGAHTIITYGHDNGDDPVCVMHDPVLP